MPPDATVAMDDALCDRLLMCLLCGQGGGTRSIDLFMIGGRPLLAARCLRCAGQDKTGAALIAQLAARERTPRKET